MWNKCPMAASHGTTESLRTAEYTESLEHFALGIQFFGIFSGFSGAQCLLSVCSVGNCIPCQKIDAILSTFDG